MNKRTFLKRSIETAIAALTGIVLAEFTANQANASSNDPTDSYQISEFSIRNLERTAIAIPLQLEYENGTCSILANKWEGDGQYQRMNNQTNKITGRVVFYEYVQDLSEGTTPSPWSLYSNLQGGVLSQYQDPKATQHPDRSPIGLTMYSLLNENNNQLLWTYPSPA